MMTDAARSIVNGTANGVGVESRVIRPSTPDTPRTTRYISAQVRWSIRRCWSAVAIDAANVISDQPIQGEQRQGHERAEPQEGQRSLSTDRRFVSHIAAR